eukprot:g47231.t1
MNISHKVEMSEPAPKKQKVSPAEANKEQSSKNEDANRPMLLVLAGDKSGSGKSTISMGILAGVEAVSLLPRGHTREPEAVLRVPTDRPVGAGQGVAGRAGRRCRQRERGMVSFCSLLKKYLVPLAYDDPTPYLQPGPDSTPGVFLCTCQCLHGGRASAGQPLEC